MTPNPSDLATALKPEAPAAGENSRTAEPCTMVIFGASGDLTRRKLIPALYEIASQKPEAPRFAVIGFARTPTSDETFRKTAAEAVGQNGSSSLAGGLAGGSAGSPAGDAKLHDEKLRAFAQSFTYVAGEYDQAGAYQNLSRKLEEVDREQHLGGNRLFYLATPPAVYPQVIEQIRKAGLAQPKGNSWTRIIIEKPFGRDLASARELNRVVLGAFAESQVYRIDHYLGKDTVQNLLVLRFGNGIFEPLWNRNYIDHVQITVAESLGIEQRAAFYEHAGALRDMVQSHVLQLASLVALEPPAAFDADDLRNEKIKVLQSIRPYTPEAVARDIIRGQYAAGTAEGGKGVPGYRQEPGVSPASTTETYVAARLLIDNWRWADVPFYLRTGKRLARQVSEIAIHFRRAPHLVFRGQGLDANWLVLNIQPEEGISICFYAKLPGQEMRLKQVSMNFSYHGVFGADERSAYATLVADCMRGDATLFDRADGVEAAWALVDPISEVWRENKAPLANYAAGGWGPREADELLERDGRHWRKP
jgi:glucose-6-phosphate 1-dehydrogenase